MKVTYHTPSPKATSPAKRPTKKKTADLLAVGAKDAMTDLETLGTVPGCPILSVGAVMFNHHALGAEFHCVIRRSSCADAGLVEDPNTLKWWSEREPEARKLLDEAEGPNAVSLKEGLEAFNSFIRTHSPGVKVWGNGSDFDNAILQVAMHRVGLFPAWAFTNNRCYRSLKGIAAGPKLVRVGVYHNALDDAKSQALHAIELLKCHPTLKL